MNKLSIFIGPGSLHTYPGGGGYVPQGLAPVQKNKFVLPSVTSCPIWGMGGSKN